MKKSKKYLFDLIDFNIKEDLGEIEFAAEDVQVKENPLL